MKFKKDLCNHIEEQYLNKGFREESEVRDSSVAQMWSAVSNTVSLLCCAVVLVIGSILLSSLVRLLLRCSF